jgi:type VI secretion system VasD/TssJ family lipoprotein
LIFRKQNNLIELTRKNVILCVLSLAMIGCMEPFLSLLGITRDVDVFIQAANDLNNGGNPVIVRLYQLTTDLNIKKETSESFWRSDQTSFQKDIVGEPKEFMLHPREVLKIKELPIHDESKYLVVAADFYKPGKDQWYYIYDVSKLEGDQILVVVRNNTLVMTEVQD